MSSERLSRDLGVGDQIFINDSPVFTGLMRQGKPPDPR